MLKMSTEYLVVGSGAGGGTVARELALRGARSQSSREAATFPGWATISSPPRCWTITGF